MAKGVGRDRNREQEALTVDLVTPHGAEVTVGAKRAEQLLARPPLTFGDSAKRRYARAGESTDAGEATTSAPAPRTGNRANTAGDDK